MKPLASISLDLDNLWSYMKTHGDLGWESFPSYLDTFIPLVLDILDELNLKITFFIVGQDAALEKNHDVLKLITERGHEVGNHSFNHEPWLHLYPKDQIKKEILDTEDYIQQATGQKPLGFRGPGFTWSKDLLCILYENGYLYDASSLPTYIGPLARIYYFWASSFSKAEKSKRCKLFGSVKDGFKKLKPYYLELTNGKRLLEIPVTTMPIIKIPFHLSYLLYLSKFSVSIMSFYLNLAISFCKMTKTAPSSLLHPLDFFGTDLVPELKFFPGMNLSSSRKSLISCKVIKKLSDNFELVSMSSYAQSHIEKNSLKEFSCN